MSTALAARAARFALALSLCALGACSAWKPIASRERWTLYARDEHALDPAPFDAALAPALVAVERELGRFEHPLRVHAWHGGVELVSGTRGELKDGQAPLMQVEGLGPARVQAFHARGSGWAGSDGIYLGEADAGAAVHELVHARLGEQHRELPLWLEEGVACWLSDGVLQAGAWQTDGFSFWPWRELRREPLAEGELARLLALHGGEDHDLRQNLLVHFVGWALVFDLRHARPEEPWPDFLERARSSFTPDEAGLAAARAALARTLADATPLEWLERRLAEPAPAARLAALLGTWKLNRPELGDRLLAQLQSETDPDTRVALAVNLLIGPAQDPFGGGRPWWRIRREVLPVLRDAALADPVETQAAHELNQAWRSRGGSALAQQALNRLARFWNE